MTFSNFGALLGGLGLFLLATSMITDGLRLAAGDALRTLLGQWTRTPLRGIASGSLITAIVQSSGAVTVATIGFVNANLLTMHQALGVVYGANIGTTMTGWLVAIVGFKIKVEVFALPMIGAGMILRLLGAGRRSGAIGEALAGFGLFFIGIDVLRTAFEGLTQGIDLSLIRADSLWGILAYVGVGFFMTVVTQSSSVAIAIVLTAASGGVLALPGAAAMVIGANVGSTSTAIFAALGATPNARRVAAAHVVFNLLTGGVALLLLPVMLALVGWLGQLLAGEPPLAMILALFHTVFNVLGVLLLWPLTPRLARFLLRHFGSPLEQLERPRYIDSTSLGTPALALDTMRLELLHVLELGRGLASALLSPQPDHKAIRGLHDAIETLTGTIDGHVAHLDRGRLSAKHVQALMDVLRITRQLNEAARLGLAAGHLQSLRATTPEFLGALQDLIQAWPTTGSPHLALDRGRREALKTQYARARDALLQNALGSAGNAQSLHQTLDTLRNLHRMFELFSKAAGRIDSRLPAALPEAAEEAVAPLEDAA